MIAGTNGGLAITVCVPAKPRGDPLASAARRVALVVAVNQPLYPLYLHWLVGAGALVACATWLSTPGFLAVALMARHHSLGARMLLVLVGVANTVWSIKLLGSASRVGLFLIPCTLIALLAVRRKEWWALVVLLGIVAVASLLLPLAGAAPVARLDAREVSSLARLNLFSVVSLTLFVCWTLGLARFSWPASPSR